MSLAVPRLKGVASGLAKAVGVVAVTAAILAQSSVLASAAERAAAFVIDANNGKVLYSKFADDPRYPASLTKMMTLYMLFDAMEAGRTTLKTPMKVSAYAAARPPTKLRLKPGSTITVEEAILGLVTLSANDASVVIAEHLAGSEAKFAEQMTSKARRLGMSRTTFRNANGLPNEGQVTTARDMATLGMALREHFPKQFGYFKTKAFNFRGRTIGSHNRLVGRIKGVDGIKTGYINASGFNLVTSFAMDGKKLVGVVFGGRTGASRDNEMAKLINQAIPQASTRGGGPLIADVSGGRQPRVHVEAVEVAAASAKPARVPVPVFSNRASVNDRIAAAYGSDAGGAIARITGSPDHPLVGREALRAALVTPRPDRQQLEVPVANALASTRSSTRQRLVPPGSIPGGTDGDPGTTGSISDDQISASAGSGWVVQIAATPNKAQALSMLSEAKAKVGPALRGAEGVTQSVASGSQTLYRARFSGFSSKEAANKACVALKKNAYSCYAVAN
ncbi:MULTISPECIES: D-alanyl-D-alanine carboxypeptidase [unclassified Aureimonas]|uniref:D-alanyl-D-alanine carboxypeptidase n=1 Tax=unclassified Aureimonas TaxID=2615206 RepID=UPI0006F50B85|nr:MULTISPECIES: D-alanyl-D-alanine carboxypeptidase [unclassified Aureimonas]KQT60300.1 D-alanyl-D-alanine carboxypeptidase [Aureimonas sp. Leaf427]KQT79176.1 D-alanyl-D-alanine carboxypeptidase [Aureimonas sp. Leaf460]